MVFKMQPISGKKQSYNWGKNGYRFVSLREAISGLFWWQNRFKGKTNCIHFCITWKRLKVQKAIKTNGVLMILKVRVFDCLKEKVSNRRQKRSRNKTFMVSRFLADFWWMLERLWTCFGNETQQEVNIKCNAKAMRKKSFGKQEKCQGGIGSSCGRSWEGPSGRGTRDVNLSPYPWYLYLII